LSRERVEWLAVIGGFAIIMAGIVVILWWML